MVDLDEFQLAKLAREMAMNIRNYKHIFADFGIDEDDYYKIEKIEFYKRAKEQFALEWNSSLSAAERVKLISAAYMEQALPKLGARMIRETEPLPAAVEVAKLFSRNAGLGEPKGTTPTGERFVITINLGTDGEGKDVVEHYDKPVAIDANDVSPKAIRKALKHERESKGE